MAVKIIPTRQDNSNYRLQVELENEFFFLQFYFSRREQSWYFSVYDADDNPIKEGTRLVLGSIHMSRVANLDKPPGEFLLFDTRAAGNEPTRDDLGTLTVLSYVESTSV